jgi:membrane fusion protein, multidrug efflux system
MKLHPLYALLGVIAASFMLAGCGEKPKGGQRPPTEVAIVTVAAERLALINELPGRLEAIRVAQVRARVPGIILKREFKEGSIVKAGQLLFRIDPATYQAALNSARASLAKAEANLTQATLKLDRYAPLVKINAISKQEYDDANALKLQAAADVASARAAVTTASLNLGYANVTAPISGRIGRAMVTEGALVGQGEATQLALIQQLDTLYVNLTQSSAEAMQLRQALKNGELKTVADDEAKVSLILEDGSIYPHEGKLLFSDITVDESTGSITVRAIFPNFDGVLMPGTFVRARLEQAVNEEALAVPQQAVQRTADGASVMVVGAEDKVEVRPVKTTASQGDNWIIGEGIKAGDRVIVEGLQKVRPGAVVKPIEWKKGSKPGAETVSASPPVAVSASAPAQAASQAASQPAKK